MIEKENMISCNSCRNYNRPTHFCDYYKKKDPKNSPCDHYDRLILYPNNIKDDEQYFIEEFHDADVDKIIEKFLESKN